MLCQIEVDVGNKIYETISFPHFYLLWTAIVVSVVLVKVCLDGLPCLWPVMQRLATGSYSVLIDSPACT